jgi:glycosyltransferase involved in cell wall biosynthesis
MQISIVTTVLNSDKTIGQCLASVRSQTVLTEHIVVDGGSTDGTLAVVEKEGGHVAKVISEPDNGIYDGMNKGIRMASGDVVGILNADDVYAAPDILENVADAFRDAAVDACYGDLVYTDSRNLGRVVRYWKSVPYDIKRFYWGWMPPHPTFFVRRQVYRQYGLFDLSLGSAADYEIMLRFLLRYRLLAVYLPTVMVRMRSGGVSNRTLKNRLLANCNDRAAWRVNRLKPYPWTTVLKPLRKIGQFCKKPGHSGFQFNRDPKIKE